MAELRRFGLADLVLLLVILAAAAGARAWYLSAFADGGRSEGPLQVQGPYPAVDVPAGTEIHGRTSPTELDSLIQNVREHDLFGSLAPFAAREERTAHTAPGYPWLLAWLESLPFVPGPAERTVRWLQAALGALTAGFYFLFARRAFHSIVVATLAGLFCALHPFWVVNSAELNDGVLASFLLAAAVALGARGGQWGGALTSLLYGLCLAGIALVRAAALPFAVVALLWFLLRARSVRGSWLVALQAFLGFVIGLTPWMLRNYQAFHDVFPVVDSAYVHLWMGNNPRATGGPMSEQAMLDALAEARREDPKALAERLGKIENQPARYQELGEPAWREVQANPAATWQRRLWAGLYFFFGEDWFKENKLWRGDLNSEAAPDWLARSYAAIFYGGLFGMLLLGVLGWRWTFGWRHESMPAALAVMWIPLPYLLSHAEALQGPRLPLDGILLCYAAFALVSLVPVFGSPVFAGSDAAARAKEIERWRHA
jgi:hypothetical protein